MKCHYNKTYLDWQKKAGEYGANQDRWMYQPFIGATDRVLDFGCGAGYMLNRLICKEKYGVDINPLALKEAQKRGIRTYKTIQELDQLRFDIIISHHTLEHVENPVGILQELRKHLKRNGLIICVVPIDDWRKQKRYMEKDINKHLYTWTPLLLGNLFVNCGYRIKKIDIMTYAWLPLSRYYYKYVPKPLYYFLSKIWCMMILARQIRITASF